MDGNDKNISPVDPLPPYRFLVFMRAVFMRAVPAMLNGCLNHALGLWIGSLESLLTR
jgi:hypothetical protein